MNFIIDPTNLNKLSIYSLEGKKLLKRYIEYYQFGGTNEETMITDEDRLILSEIRIVMEKLGAGPTGMERIKLIKEYFEKITSPPGMTLLKKRKQLKDALEPQLKKLYNHKNIQKDVSDWYMKIFKKPIEENVTERRSQETAMDVKSLPKVGNKDTDTTPPLPPLKSKSPINSSSKIDLSEKSKLIPCKQTFCKTPNVICKTDYKGDGGVRKCGVVFRTNWPESINKYFDKTKTYDDLPISAVFYNIEEGYGKNKTIIRNQEDSKKLEELNSVIKSINHVDSQINIDANDMLGEGTYGEVYTYTDPIEKKEMVIKIMKQPQDSIGGYYGTWGHSENEQLFLNISKNTDGEIELYEMDLVSGHDRNSDTGGLDEDNIYLGQKTLDFNYSHATVKFFRDAYIIDEFIYNNKTKRFEVNLDDQPKTQLFSYLSEAVLLHKLSQMEVGKDERVRTVAPKIYGVYLYINDINQFYVAYTMELGKSLDNILEDVMNNKKVDYEIDGMQKQIYELMTAQYDAGYINLDLNPNNLIVNKEGNLQIIDSGSLEFTLEVEKLKEPSISEGDDSDLKKNLVIFAQQLLIFGYIERLFKTHHIDFRKSITIFTLFTNMIPTAIGELKKLNYSKEKVTEYLNSINKNTMFSYRKILTKYSVSDSVFDNIKMHYLDTISTYDKKFTKFLIEIVNNAYTYYDRFFS